MCPTPLLLVPASTTTATVAAVVAADSKPDQVSTALEGAMAGQDSASTEALVKLSALRGTPAIIDALNAQTRRRAAQELAREEMTPAHPDYMCFEMVRHGAPGKVML